jgi:hypothetical protein
MYDAYNREPLSVEVYITDEAGETKTLRSEINGRFQIDLNQGDKYVIATKGYLVCDSVSTIAIPSKLSDNVINQNFPLEKLNLGQELIAVDAFSYGSTVLNPPALAQILKLRSILDYNPKIRVKIYVSSEDTYISQSAPRQEAEKSTTSSKSKKGKKAKKSNKEKAPKLNNKIGSEEDLKDMLAKRSSNLRDILTSMRISDQRYSIEEVLVNTPAPNNGKSQENKIIKRITLKAEIDNISK